MRQSFFPLAAVAAMLTACQPSVSVIEGNIHPAPQNGKMYLCEVVNEYRGHHRAIDSCAVTDGRFTFTLKDNRPAFYFVGDETWHGGYVFTDGEGRKLTLTAVEINPEAIEWKTEGSALDRKYREFQAEKYRLTFRQQRDSLDELFMNARERGDREEMARIKEASRPYYEQAHGIEKELVEKWVEANKTNPFGLYLHYMNQFVHRDFQTMEDIREEEAYLASFGEAAQQTVYPDLIRKRLADYQGCAIGQEAPEITGLDTLGKEIRLSDFRGKYVIVDFWNSYCHWCREETPWMLKALERFQGKPFTILGVSSDRREDLWKQAIHEDQSYWDHLMLQKGDSVMDRYCIKGIPHIILVGPDGKILAKELRHEQLWEVPARYLE